MYKNKIGNTGIRKKTNPKTIENIKKKEINLAIAYFQNEYKNYTIDTTRLSYLKKIKKICKENNIKLIISISPMNEEHLLKLVADDKLYIYFIEFKKILVESFLQVHDFNNLTAFKFKNSYWSDSVHPSKELANLMVEKIFSKKVSDDIPKDFGIIVEKDNINEYIEKLKIKIYSLKKNIKH